MNMGAGSYLFPIKEVIQPQVPLRLPCYDFAPVARPVIGPCPQPEGWLARGLPTDPTPVA